MIDRLLGAGPHPLTRQRGVLTAMDRQLLQPAIESIVRAANAALARAGLRLEPALNPAAKPGAVESDAGAAAPSPYPQRFLALPILLSLGRCEAPLRLLLPIRSRPATQTDQSSPMHTAAGPAHDLAAAGTQLDATDQPVSAQPPIAGEFDDKALDSSQATDIADKTRQRPDQAPPAVTLAAIIEETGHGHEEIESLAPGDLLVSDLSPDGEIILTLDGVPAFAARLGQYNGHRAVTITRKLS